MIAGAKPQDRAAHVFQMGRKVRTGPADLGPSKSGMLCKSTVVVNVVSVRIASPFPQDFFILCFIFIPVYRGALQWRFIVNYPEATVSVLAGTGRSDSSQRAF
jgi:hypothetical protein